MQVEGPHKVEWLYMYSEDRICQYGKTSYHFSVIFFFFFVFFLLYQSTIPFNIIQQVMRMNQRKTCFFPKWLSNWETSLSLTPCSKSPHRKDLWKEIIPALKGQKGSKWSGLWNEYLKYLWTPREELKRRTQERHAKKESRILIQLLVLLEDRGLFPHFRTQLNTKPDLGPWSTQWLWCPWSACSLFNPDLLLQDKLECHTFSVIFPNHASTQSCL